MRLLGSRLDLSLATSICCRSCPPAVTFARDTMSCRSQQRMKVDFQDRSIVVGIDNFLAQVDGVWLHLQQSYYLVYLTLSCVPSN
jgi:hypothetical protein